MKGFVRIDLRAAVFGRLQPAVILYKGRLELSAAQVIKAARTLDVPISSAEDELVGYNRLT